MPRTVAAIRDRGGNEPYSDTNAPFDLERTYLTTPPAAPAAGRSREWTPDGKSLRMIAADGTVSVIGPDSVVRDTLANATLITETVLATFTLPANYLVAGTTLNLRAAGQVSGLATLIYRVRIGTAGTTADPVAVTFATSAAGAANAHTTVDALVACLTAGTTGTATGSGIATLASAVLGPVTAAFAAATVNTTVAQKVSLTVQQSVAQTLTARIATLERVSAV